MQTTTTKRKAGPSDLHAKRPKKMETLESEVRTLLGKGVTRKKIWTFMGQSIPDSKTRMEIFRACLKPIPKPTIATPRTNALWWKQPRLWRILAERDGYRPHDGIPCSFSEQGSFCRICGFSREERKNSQILKTPFEWLRDGEKKPSQAFVTTVCRKFGSRERFMQFNISKKEYETIVGDTVFGESSDKKKEPTQEF